MFNKVSSLQVTSSILSYCFFPSDALVFSIVFSLDISRVLCLLSVAVLKYNTRCNLRFSGLNERSQTQRRESAGVGWVVIAERCEDGFFAIQGVSCEALGC